MAAPGILVPLVQVRVLISQQNVGLTERLGPGLQNQLEWSDSTTRLQMPLWCNGQHTRPRICW